MEQDYNTNENDIGAVASPSAQADRKSAIETAQMMGLLIAVVLIAIPYVWNAAESYAPTIVRQVIPVQMPAPVSPFAGIELQAEAAYVLDVTRGDVLFAQKENDRLPLASITKVMTALVVADTVPSDTVVTLRKDDIGQEGDNGLLVGEKWRLGDIIDLTLTMSSNDGASALASVAGAVAPESVGGITESEYDARKRDFILRMNMKATELELVNTSFLNESGLDISEEKSGGYSTAEEVARLFAYAIKEYPDTFDATARDWFSVNSLSDVRHPVQNTNQLVDSIPGLIAGKTGFTDLAQGNLVIAFDAGLGRPIVVVVLGSDKDGRFDDVDKLVKASLKTLVQ